jgi:hypothetical protein
VGSLGKKGKHMGLDQVALAAKDGEEKVIAEWRKHNRLQGWMENLYRSQGGTEVFNCQPIDLTVDNINSLEDSVRNADLPKTEGFFFGSDSYEWMNHYANQDLEFIEKAKEALADGWTVTYSCWW